MDIQALTAEAREYMLTQGSVMPMIHLQLEKNYVLMALDILSDSQSIAVQCGILARLGWEECKKYPDEKPVAVGFFAEAWVAVGPQNHDYRMRPKNDPNRKEVIMVEMWQAEGPQCCRLPVIRDHKKRVIDVGEVEKYEKGISWQLASFLQGVQDSQKSDEEVFSRLNDAIQKKMARLSPEAIDALKSFMKQEGLPEDLLNG